MKHERERRNNNLKSFIKKSQFNLLKIKLLSINSVCKGNGINPNHFKYPLEEKKEKSLQLA